MGYIIQGDHLHRGAADVADCDSLYVLLTRMALCARQKTYHIAPWKLSFFNVPEEFT